MRGAALPYTSVRTTYARGDWMGEGRHSRPSDRSLRQDSPSSSTGRRFFRTVLSLSSYSLIDSDRHLVYDHACAGISSGSGRARGTDGRLDDWDSCDIGVPRWSEIRERCVAKLSSDRGVIDIGAPSGGVIGSASHSCDTEQSMLSLYNVGDSIPDASTHSYLVSSRRESGGSCIVVNTVADEKGPTSRKIYKFWLNVVNVVSYNNINGCAGCVWLVV